jgi:hypothetical protein
MPKFKLLIPVAVAAFWPMPAVVFAGPEGLPQPTVDIPTDYKAAKNVIEEREREPSFIFSSYAGYESEYNFRGTDLMPDSDGAGFVDAEVTFPKWHLTLGVYAIHQFGDASAPSWSIGEGGGGGGGATVPAEFFGFFGPPVLIQRFPTTIQTRFNELDVFLSYKISLGPIDITVGDIGFFIDRSAETFERDFIVTPGVIWNPDVVGSRGRNLFLGPFDTVKNEVFDRLYVRLSTSKIPHILPQITYYQTVLNEGDDPEPTRVIHLQSKTGVRYQPLPYSKPHDERNEALGGYLEAKIAATFPIIRPWLDLNPSQLVSVSFRDRTKPDITNGFAGRPFTGFNHTQSAVELDVHLTRRLNLIGFGDYSYHISDPPPGTSRDEFWGGARVAFSFP